MFRRNRGNENSFQWWLITNRTVKFLVAAGNKVSMSQQFPYIKNDVIWENIKNITYKKNGILVLPDEKTIYTKIANPILFSFGHPFTHYVQRIIFKLDRPKIREDSENQKKHKNDNWSHFKSHKIASYRRKISTSLISSNWKVVRRRALTIMVFWTEVKEKTLNLAKYN